MYAKVKDGNVVKYPYGINDLKKDYPNTSFPTGFLSTAGAQSYDVVEVKENNAPEKAGWNAVSGGIVLNGTEWERSWTLEPKVLDELTESDIEDVPAPVQDGYVAEAGEAALDGDVWKHTWSLVENTWLENRILEYGSTQDQLAFITENGLEAWQTKVAEIKAKYPKTSEEKCEHPDEMITTEAPDGTRRYFEKKIESGPTIKRLPLRGG